MKQHPFKPHFSLQKNINTIVFGKDFRAIGGVITPKKHLFRSVIWDHF